MENVKVKKINVLYLLGYIFLPMIICAICFEASYLFFPEGTMAVILLMGPSILSFVWWVFGGRFIYNHKRKELEKKLDENGFKRIQTFYGSGNMVVVDSENYKIAMLFFWNPFESYILPTNRISKAWTDDGKSGAGFMAGSSRVSFLFKIDEVTVRVNTFTSNQRWRMDSNYILEGISKADMMVEILEKAKSMAK